MNFKLLSLAGLLSISLSSLAMQTQTVILPDAATLTSRLREIGMDLIIENTDIVDKLSDQTLYPEGVAMVVASSISDYEKVLKKSLPPEQASLAVQLVRRYPPLLYQAILKDSPDALKRLETLRIYTPKK